MQRLLTSLATSPKARHLFHFTDVRNLPGIKTHGLLSLRALGERGIDVAAPGGNELSHREDVRVGLDGHVHLCLCNEHPMEYVARQDGRIESSVFLRVSPEVLKRDGVMFCNEVSNGSGAVARPIAEVDDYLDHEVVYQKTDWKNPAIMEWLQAARKFEILVPDHIAVEFLRMP